MFFRTLAHENTKIDIIKKKSIKQEEKSENKRYSGYEKKQSQRPNFIRANLPQGSLLPEAVNELHTSAVSFVHSSYDMVTRILG